MFAEESSETISRAAAQCSHDADDLRAERDALKHKLAAAEEK